MTAVESISDALDRLNQSCPRCGVEIEDATVIQGVGLVVWPCGHVIDGE